VIFDFNGWRVKSGPPSRARMMIARAASRAALAGICVARALFAGALPAQSASEDSARDSTFLLATADPARDPSPFIGNGHVGLVIPAAGIGASRSLIAGLYENAPGDVPRIASAPAWNAIDVFDGERWLSATTPDSSSFGAYSQVIDMRNGVARTSYEWSSGSRRTSVRTESFISRADPSQAAIRIDLTPRAAARMRVRFALANWPPPRRLPLATLEKVKREWGPRELWYPGHMVVRTRSAALLPGGAALAMTATPEGRALTLAESATITWARDLSGVATRTTSHGDTAMMEVAFDAAPGKTYTFSDLVSIVSSIERAEPAAQAARSATAARAIGYDAIAARSAVSWRKRWETDIELDGDPALQRVVRSMLFYLLCSADSGTALAIPPMGLSSAGYYGHVFWDSDTWMFPALVLTYPDIARSLVDFRARTVNAARANARANGFRGAQYPWEADDRGNETTPHFAAQNAHSEIHVNGDVAVAQWQYFLATGDSAWLARKGFPVIRATADFWVSRATHDSSRDLFHINDVVSVAEGLVGVNDDAYTNGVAKRNLEIATTASARLGVGADPRWATVAAKLHMPFDSTTQSFRTYAGAPDSTLGWITPLLSYPLGVPMSDRAKRTHLMQATKNIKDEEQGAMMGVTLLSVDAAELGDHALVDSLLPYSYRAHLQGPFLMLSETPTNHAVNFLTGAGGFLQQVIFGYTGLRIRDDGLVPQFPAILPSHIKRLVLHGLHVRGKRIDVIVDSAGRRLVPHAGGAAR
jgi:trehalose/maltose hydrolase-like predicted phosphorylase